MAGVRRRRTEHRRIENTEPVSLDELLEQLDVVALHVPLLEQTRGLIGAQRG